MAALIAEHRITVVFCLLLTIGFLWLDITLYFRVQNMRPVFPTHESVTSPVSGSVPSTNGHIHDDGIHIFSPFKGLSVKMVMMDEVNNYVFTPIAELFNDITCLAKTFTFITPNIISFAGLIAALVSAKLVTSESFLIRRIAVLVFQIRTFMDALDGIVARERRGILIHVTTVGTNGFFVDAFCDTVGFAAFFIGVYIYTRRSVPRNCKYIPLDIRQTTLNGYSSPSQKHVFIICLCYAIQLAASSIFWNIYLDRYHHLLEDPAVTVSQATLQNEVMKSSITWSLMWFWKVLNSHSFMQYLLLAVYLNRSWEFMQWSQWPGLMAIAILSFFSEIHVRDITSYLNRAKMIP